MLKSLEQTNIQLEIEQNQKKIILENLEGHKQREQEYIQTLDEYCRKLDKAEHAVESLQKMKKNIMSSDQCHCSELLEIIEMTERRNLQIDKELLTLINIQQRNDNTLNMDIYQ